MQIAAANAAVDRHIESLHERTGQLRCSSLYGRNSTPLAGDGKTGRFDMGGMLEWDQPDCNFFRDILVHPTLIPYIHAFIGKGYRLDHSPLLISMKEGSEGHTLHGGAVSETGAPAYDCRQGSIRTQLLTISINLTPTGPGDGGFCIVPGSHKANFPTPGTPASSC